MAANHGPPRQSILKVYSVKGVDGRVNSSDFLVLEF